MSNKWTIFKQNKKAYYSLLILIVLFLCSLPAELIFNDAPLVLVADGRLYFPFVKEYSPKDFGGASSIPITDYQPEALAQLLAAETAVDEGLDMFGEYDGGEADDGRQAILPKSIHSLWTPIPHDYKSRTLFPKSGKENLASPVLNQGSLQRGQLASSWADKHLLGTDEHGKDVLARIVYGFRISMLFGLGLALSGTIVGTILGAIQGYFGGWFDLVGQRLTELWESMPRLYILIIFSSFLSKKITMTDTQHYWLLFGILNLTAWLGMSVYMRAEFLKLKAADYVKSAKALGVSNFAIMRRHILPNALTPIVTFFPFAVTGGIVALVSLDFLGLGVQYPAPSLGDLLSQGQQNLFATWIILPTFLLLTVTLVLLTFIGEGLRSAYDPKS